MTDRYLCFHGHFYQPPREDPFTGQIPREPGAEPYHDFNEKINAECYRPNAMLGNFETMSFNVGPTLASWLDKYARETYDRIVQSDRNSGNGIAQSAHHTILPLAQAHLQQIIGEKITGRR